MKDFSHNGSNTAGDRGTPLNSGDSQNLRKQAVPFIISLPCLNRNLKPMGTFPCSLWTCHIYRIVLFILFCYCWKVHMCEHICIQYMLVIFISNISYSLPRALPEPLPGIFPIFISLHPISAAHKQVFRVIQPGMVTLPIFPPKKRDFFLTAINCH